MEITTTTQLHEKNAAQHENWISKLFFKTWEMELLLSGFVLYLLLQAPDRLDLLTNRSLFATKSDIVMVSLAFLLSATSSIVFLLIPVLITHLVLRGYWIGIIGLNSVFPEGVHREELHLSERLHGYLSKKGKINLVSQAKRIDDFCSGIFSFGFLIISFLVAAFTLIFYLICFACLLEASQAYSVVLVFQSVLLAAFFTCGIIHLFDLLTLGWFRQINTHFLSFVFYWTHRIFRIITLSFLFEGIFYVFAVRLRRLYWLLMVVFLVLMVLISVGKDNHQLVVGWNPSQKSFFLPDFYENRLQSRAAREYVSIQNEVVSETYLKVFFPQRWITSIRLADQCRQGPDRESEEELNATERLSCYQTQIQLLIDENKKPFKLSYYVYDNQREKGLVTFLDIADLRRGQHVLQVVSDHEGSQHGAINIPFWYARPSTNCTHVEKCYLEAF